jgi:hypothetical protein
MEGVEIGLMIAKCCYHGWVNRHKAYEAIQWLRDNGYLKNKAANQLENIVDQQDGIYGEAVSKRVYRCTNCHETGHNKRTCPYAD